MKRVSRKNIPFVDTGAFITNLRRMLRHDCSPNIVHEYVEKTINSRVNAERAELVVLMRELDIDAEASNEVLAAARSGATVTAVVMYARTQLVDLVQSRVEDPNEFDGA